MGCAPCELSILQWEVLKKKEIKKSKHLDDLNINLHVTSATRGEKKMTLHFKSAAFMDGDCRHIPMSHTPNVRHYRTTLRTNRFICSKISNI